MPEVYSLSRSAGVGTNSALGNRAANGRVERRSGWSFSIADAQRLRVSGCGRSDLQTEEDQLNNHIPKGRNLARDIEFVEKTQETTYSALARLDAAPALARPDAELLSDLHTLLQDYPPLLTAAKNGIAAYERTSTLQAARDGRLAKQVGTLFAKLGVSACSR
jgi:hypothetical protein